MIVPSLWLNVRKTFWEQHALPYTYIYFSDMWHLHSPPPPLSFFLLKNKIFFKNIFFVFRWYICLFSVLIISWFSSCFLFSSRFASFMILFLFFIFHFFYQLLYFWSFSFELFHFGLKAEIVLFTLKWFNLKICFDSVCGHVCLLCAHMHICYTLLHPPQRTILKGTKRHVVVAYIMV